MLQVRQIVELEPLDLQKALDFVEANGGAFARTRELPDLGKALRSGTTLMVENLETDDLVTLVTALPRSDGSDDPNEFKDWELAPFDRSYDVDLQAMGMALIAMHKALTEVPTERSEKDSSSVFAVTDAINSTSIESMESAGFVVIPRSCDEPFHKAFKIDPSEIAMKFDEAAICGLAKPIQQAFLDGYLVSRSGKRVEITFKDVFLLEAKILETFLFACNCAVRKSGTN